MKVKGKLLILLLVLVVASVIAVNFYTNTHANDSNSLRVSGNIEVTEVQASFKVAGHVEQRLLSEGQEAAAGQIIARLDETDLVQDVAIRKTEVEMAQATLAELEAGSREQEIATAEAALGRVEAELAQQQRDYDRNKRLYEQNVISTQEYELAQLAYNVAATKFREAEEKLQLIKEGPRPEKIQQARAKLEQTKQLLQQAQIHLSYATLKAPMSGVVLSDHIEPGEYVVPGTPIVTIGALENVWLRAYINETDLGRVMLGQRVLVTTDSYPNKRYEGHISFIASESEFTPKNVQTDEERVKLVYRIKIDIPNPKLELKPGMPADAEIALGEGG